MDFLGIMAASAERPKMSDPATTGMAEPERGAPGSLHRVVGPPDLRWITYLMETGELSSYDGSCECYACQNVRDGYDGWKYKKLWRSNAPHEPRGTDA